MTPWSSFFPHLMVHVPGCTFPLATQELRSAAQKFFHETRAWREWMDPFTAVDGRREYDIDPSPGSRVVSIEKATRDGNEFAIQGAFSQPSDASRHEQDGQGLASPDRLAVFLSRNPTAGSVYQLFCSLTVNDSAAGLPNHLFDQYRMDIMHGAKAALRLIPDTTFYNEKLAAVDEAKFLAAIDMARTQAWMSNTGTVPRPKVRWC